MLCLRGPIVDFDADELDPFGGLGGMWFVSYYNLSIFNNSRQISSTVRGM
jgi:hypothetical protein